MNGDKPFYERYKIEETAMVVETLKADGSVDGEPERFEGQRISRGDTFQNATFEARTDV